MKTTLFILFLSILPVAAQPAGPYCAELRVKVVNTIKARLKDPDSFQMDWVRCKDSPDLGFIVYGQFRARNEFGGYAAPVRFIYNGKTLLTSENTPRFAEAWKLI